MKNTKILTLTFAVTVLAFGLAGCSKKETTTGQLVQESDTVVTTSDSSGNEAAGVESDFSTVGDFKEVATDGKNPKIKDTFTFDTNYTDNSWKNVEFSIDKAKVVDTEKYQENDDETTYTGALSLHYELKNDGDSEVKLHPESAVVILEDGTQVKAESFRNTLSSAFSKGKKEGYIQFKFNKSDSDDLSKIKEINVDFKGKTVGDDKEDVDHEYKADLNTTKDTADTTKETSN
ncbi:hypothetical protein BG262_06930 [Floricoccus penangensis]|uniref:DUF4352 domain-containing protein n=1 Tax=Floricoccus penangensis TaxID=1859475 RepID=A0A9Q5JF82_9LACT|nr:hypothetical protein [Floricoccus penangensis]OFI45725.1 hypothetical protein BG262_06930 [Floricoccus penangensis]